MALLLWPPPSPSLPLQPITGTFPADARYPNNVQDPRATLSLASVGGPDIWGRAGNPPPEELTDWISTSLNETPTSDPEWGTYMNVFRWFAWVGRDQPLVNPPYISVEIRTAEEVAAFSGDETAFAYTTTSDEIGPPDGQTSDGRDITWWTGNPARDQTKFIRILIRDDLAYGGAGPQWAGRRFFIESLCHEFGHVALTLLTWLYDEAFVIANLCDIFGRPSTEWDSESIPWNRRILEATCEYFKDVAFPNRVYNHRTRLRVPAARGDDFVLLMYRLLESPYWDAGNIDDLRASENGFFFNTGPASFVHDKHSVTLWFVNHDFHPNPSTFVSPTSRHKLAWKPEWTAGGGPAVVMHYNFDAEGTPADPGEDPLTGVGYRWGSVQGDYAMTGDVYDLHPGYPRYAFESTAEGEPGNRVNWGMEYVIQTLDGVPVGRILYKLTREPDELGYEGVRDEDGNVVTPDTFIPQAKGVFPLDFSLVEYDPGFTALPDEGFRVTCSIMGTLAVTQPKFTLYPSEPVPFPLDAEGLSVMWPWLEYVGQRTDFLVAAEWPYKHFPGKLSIGSPKRGARPSVNRIAGRKVRTT